MIEPVRIPGSTGKLEVEVHFNGEKELVHSKLATGIKITSNNVDELV